MSSFFIIVIGLWLQCITVNSYCYCSREVTFTGFPNGFNPNAIERERCCQHSPPCDWGPGAAAECASPPSTFNQLPQHTWGEYWEQQEQGTTICGQHAINNLIGASTVSAQLVTDIFHEEPNKMKEWLGSLVERVTGTSKKKETRKDCSGLTAVDIEKIAPALNLRIESEILPSTNYNAAGEKGFKNWPGANRWITEGLGRPGFLGIIAKTQDKFGAHWVSIKYIDRSTTTDREWWFLDSELGSPKYLGSSTDVGQFLNTYETFGGEFGWMALVYRDTQQSSKLVPYTFGLFDVNLLKIMIFVAMIIAFGCYSSVLCCAVVSITSIICYYFGIKPLQENKKRTKQRTVMNQV